MAAQPPIVSSLSWALVIETLANYKEIDITTLINLFNRSPEITITSDVGSKAREMVSFRILERLFDLDTRPLKSAARRSGVGFDFSKSCEEVLQHILGEMNEPNIWNESEMSKWNARPFIAYKRSCLPDKSNLQRLKDTLMKGKSTFSTSLTQLATSLHLNQHGTKVHIVNGDTANNEEKSASINDEICQDKSNEENRKGEDGHYVEQISESQPSNGATFDQKGEDESHQKELNGTKVLEGNGATFDHGEKSSSINDEVRQDISNEGNKISEDGDHVEQMSESQPSNDELYKKELNDILAKKQVFFSSVCKGRQGVTHRKKANRCMKCSKGGGLLVCSSNNCSFVFHKSCLVSNSSFDCESTGKFYCPFCRCSQSVSNFWEAKKKASVARNDLASFTRITNHIPKKNLNESKIPNGLSNPDLIDERSESSGGRGSSEVSKKEDCVDRAVRPQKRTKLSNGVPNPDLNIESSESSGGKRCNEGSQKENCVDRTVRPQKRTKPSNGIPNHDLVSESSESRDGKGCIERSQNEGYMSRIRPRKLTKPCTNLHVPQRRRVPVPWTQSEEETLKKWVEKFTSGGHILERGFPWSRILDLGASKFQNSRTPIDLKDKWRNMLKASKKSA